MQICHIASHKGNVGDLINHQGFYNNMLPAEVSANIERIELRDFYYSYNQRRVFDEHLARQLNKCDLVVIGGGGYLDAQWPESETGTTLSLSRQFIDSLSTKVLVNAIGYHEYPGRTNASICRKFSSFLGYVSQLDNWMVTVRNDGSYERLAFRYGETALHNIKKVPAVVGMVLFAQPIVTILFRRGAFDADSVALTAYALSFYAIGMIGWGITDVSLRAFYAFQNTKTPTILAIVGVAVNIVLNLVLSRYIGIGGLALATSIAALTVSFLMLLGLRKKIGALGLTKNVIAFFKIVIASLIMGVGARMSFGFLLNMMGQNLSLILSIILAVIIYALLIYFMRIEEVDNVVDRLKLRFKCN